MQDVVKYRTRFKGMVMHAHLFPYGTLWPFVLSNAAQKCNHNERDINTGRTRFRAGCESQDLVQTYTEYLSCRSLSISESEMPSNKYKHRSIPSQCGHDTL